MSNLKITISIVDYKKGDRVCESLTRLFDLFKNHDYHITIYDNSCCTLNSSIISNFLDKSANERVSYWIGDQNIGYTKATNLTLANQDSDFYLILNPDILIPNTFSIEKLLNKALELDYFSVIGVRQTNDDGTTPTVVRRFPSPVAQVSKRASFLKGISYLSNIADDYEMADFDYSANQYVDWTQSSFWLVKAEVWQLLGGLDERFFLFMADPDFCLRAKALGLHAYYFSEQTVIADGKRASSVKFSEILTSKPFQHHVIDAIKYYLIHGITRP